MRTGAFSLTPRYGNRSTVITGWVGTGEVVLEGRDMAAIAQVAGRLPTVTVARVGYALSRETRERVEAEAASQAIARFRARAGDYAKQFGFGGFSVREVNVGSSIAVFTLSSPGRIQGRSANASRQLLQQLADIEKRRPFHSRQCTPPARVPPRRGRRSRLGSSWRKATGFRDR